jgi:Phage tail sheath C-terminal domain
MALVSPGVEVTIIDESQYLPSAANSVPLVVLATASNKLNASKTGVAPGTLTVNANTLYQVTSQRDLVNLYGQPFFYTTTNGTPIQGYELNEYGLLAAYSLLGVTNRCYVLRANIDLASLVGQTGRPVGNPADGTYWLDTTQTTWGIYEFNATTGKFVLQTPMVITDTALLGNNGAPLSSLGNIGDYAVVATEKYGTPTGPLPRTYYKKSSNNVWVGLGGTNWQIDTPVIQGTNSNPVLTPGDTFDLGISGLYTVTITVPDDGGGVGSANGVASAITNLGWTNLTANVVDGKLNIYTSQHESNDSYVEISNPTGTGLVLDELGIPAMDYYQPITVYGTSAQMPLWTQSQTIPRPTGSVWIKVGAAGVGYNPIMSEWSSITSSWINKNVTLAVDDVSAIYALDATGGQMIPAGTVYSQYNASGFAASPIYFYERVATGPTVATGTNTNLSLPSGVVSVTVSVPGTNGYSSEYSVSVSSSSNASDFVAAWTAANIPYTNAIVTTDGAVQLTHTQGGVIVMDDNSLAGNNSSGILSALGFVPEVTAQVKYGPVLNYEYANTPTTQVNPRIGASGLTVDVMPTGPYYITVGAGVSNGGIGYVVGDQLLVLGTDVGGASPANNLILQITQVDQITGTVQAVNVISGIPPQKYSTEISNWVEFTYIPNEGAPTLPPLNNTNWFYSVTNQVDIMVQKNGSWIGYRNTAYDDTGAPAATGSNTTDPNGPIIAATAPTTQSDGTTALSYGDLWIDSADLENYPVIYRWEMVDGMDQWVLIDNTDQVSSSGVLFADARWATSGTVNPANDPIPTIVSLLSSNYLDLDAPDPTLYPQGMLLFNTRRSGYNIKQYRVNYFNGNTFPGAMLPDQTDAWVSVSGLQANGAPYMGRKAQRNMVVKALRIAVATNTDIRDEDNFFNLMATPNYPELQPDMVVLNEARDETVYIIGDTPMRLPADATAIQAWANNAAGAESTGEDGLVTRNTYLGLFYPSGLTTDPRTGNLVAVPPSHMMLYTFLKNDSVAYPWFAAAGTRRGIIYNSTNIGYLDATTGEFITIKTNVGLRDVLYTDFINPLTFFTGIGLLNYGNKTSYDSQSALDRTNVVRLICYIRRQLTIAARPFVFEPNDQITRASIAGVVQSLMVDLKAKRGIYDYLVQCDEQNNPPAVIDRNELYVNVAIEPTKAAEFIYIPVRVYNTGEIATLGK